MSKCDLQILFDRPDRTYKFGEFISGAIKISAHADFHCRKTTLIREWKTAGRGNSATGGGEGILFVKDEEFHSGETKEYPFRFVAPNGPVSYQGHLLRVEWHLRAHVDIALAVDARREENFFLVAGETSEAILLGSEEPLKDLPETAGELSSRMTMAKVLAVPFFLIGLVMIYLSNWHPFTLALGLAAAGFGGWQIFLILRNKFAQQKLGELAVDIHPDELRAGDQIECKVLLPSPAAARLEKITATLKGEERVTSGAGNHKSMHTHTLYEHTVEQTISNAVPVENNMQFNLPLQIPPRAPSTFRAPDNALHWSIRVQIYIPDWPDWVQEFPITVFP
jgi:hypothetical protein